MRLNTIIIDNDKPATDLMKEYCKSSKLVNVVETFHNPVEFVNASTYIEYDLCMLDINLPMIDGLTVVRTLNGKPFIFVTASNERLKEALDVSPVDILSKPVQKQRLDQAFEKTAALLWAKQNKSDNRNYKLFDLLGTTLKLSICSTDILYVTSDKLSPRNKKIVLKNGERHTLINYTVEELQQFSPGLIRLNRTDLVSIEAVQAIENNVLLLKGIQENGRQKQIILSRYSKKHLLEQM